MKSIYSGPCMKAIPLRMCMVTFHCVEIEFHRESCSCVGYNFAEGQLILCRGYSFADLEGQFLWSRG